MREIGNSLRRGKRELELRMHPEAEAQGLSLAELARQVRQGFHGEEAQPIQRGRDDVQVVVRYPAEERRSISDLERIRVRTPEGDELPFAAVASLTRRGGYASSGREAGRRTVNVRADVDTAASDVAEILADLEREVPLLLVPIEDRGELDRPVVGIDADVALLVEVPGRGDLTPTY